MACAHGGTLTDSSAFRMPRMRLTAGELLADGAIFDLVREPAQAGLSLLLADGSAEPRIGSTLAHGGDIYQAIPVDPSVLSAVRFPSSLAPYGTIAELFERIASLYRRLLGWSEESARLKTVFDIASWCPELLPISLTLCFVGPTQRQIFNLFSISTALCRRALPVARLCDRLPFLLRPTLHVNDPMLSFEDCAFWSATGIRGLYAPGPAGTIRALSVPKVIVVYDPDSLDAWGEEVILVEPPATETPDVDGDLVASIAAEFQPRMQQYRLDFLRNGKESNGEPYPPAASSLARSLFAVVQYDPTIVQILTEAFETREEERRRIRDRNPRIAVQNAIWDPLHRAREIGVTEIAARVTAIVRSLGGANEYNARQIGWILRNLGLKTASDGRRKVLKFSDVVCSKVHAYVRQFRLQLPFFSGCADCKSLQAAEDKPVL